ncbi:hypothetical protein Mterra_03544 [Calidithermus terrae]|uniref:Outer membrane protein beta-barrel domain protein n=1 Tax=Calidithermus terrae TaxID=1408545 RepID=A0A399E8L6_9DEIN|nr:hypothetical protein [Calidithermus terrae]RIH80186.1 hypothetical protein Mterra_03544 [Calidithermus terrae]
MTKHWKKLILAGTAALGLSSAALADGLSVTVDAPLVPGFSIASSFNYNVETTTGFVVGGSLMPGYGGGQFVLVGRLGAKYAQDLISDFNTELEGYVGLGTFVYVLPSPVGFSLDASAGLKFKHTFSGNSKLYADLDLVGIYFPQTGTFVPFVGGDLGLKLDLVPNTDIYVQGALGSYVGASPLGYDVRGAVYFAFTPQAKLGVSMGYGNMNYAINGQPALTGIGPDAGFSVRLGFQFVEEPNTIGTPGSHMP